MHQTEHVRGGPHEKETCYYSDDLELTKHRNGKGAAAEVIPSKVMRELSNWFVGSVCWPTKQIHEEARGILYMLAFVKKLFMGEKCYFCNKPTKDKRYYRDDRGNKIAVCVRCAVYAESRAYRKYR